MARNPCAWTDQGASLDFNRPGARHPADSIPDIDLLVPRGSLDRVKRYARAARHSDFPVSIDTFWSECWIDYRPASEVSYLTHRAIRIPVRTELLTPATARLLGQQVAAVDPRTLLHIYGTVSAARRKDTPRIAALTEARPASRPAGRAPRRVQRADRRRQRGQAKDQACSGD